MHDPVRARAILFGGFVWAGRVPSTFTPTWHLLLQRDWPDEQCANGVDDDLDGAIEGANPDCRFDLARAACGGGSCDLSKECGTCPADCGSGP